MRKAKISDEVKTFIVQSLACFDSPSVVAAAVLSQYGLVMTRQAVEGYDPTKAAGQRLSPKLKAIFEGTRDSFADNLSKIAISHKAVRLRAIQRMSYKAEEQGNMVLASALLKQAAEEVGGVYTNRREITGKDAGPIQTETRTWREILRAEHKGRLANPEAKHD